MFSIKPQYVTCSNSPDQKRRCQTETLTFPLEVSFKFRGSSLGFLCSFREGSENHVLRDCSSGSPLTTRPSTRSHRKRIESKEILKIINAR